MESNVPVVWISETNARQELDEALEKVVSSLRRAEFFIEDEGQ